MGTPLPADGLPLLSRTPRRWAELAASRLDEFLADHAVCEQQAALSALSLIGHYPEDGELVERMTSLAIEEVSHLRRVAGLLRRRDVPPARRRANPYVRGLRARITHEREGDLKLDRLLVCALIEARSCERFTLLHETVGDSGVRDLLHDLGPAEKRHWRMFWQLAARDVSPAALGERWRRWLEIERGLMRGRGVSPTVHG